MLQGDESYNTINDLVYQSLCLTLIMGSNIQQLMSNIQLQLNQEIYFLDTSTLEVFETYEINNMKTAQKLGVFNNNIYEAHHNEDKSIIEQNFLYRRSNFKGLVLRTMIEIENPFIWFNVSNFKSVATYFSENQTYDVTGMIQGMFYEVLKTFEEELNFTTRIYKRQDGVWGGGTIDKDGHVKTIGMITNLVDGSADLIATPLSIVPPRNLIVDFLLPITYNVASLHIGSHQVGDQLDLTTYVKPFSLNLWILVFVMACVMTLLIYLIANVTGHPEEITIWKIPSRLWTCLIANFGGKPGPTKLDSVQAYVVTIFTGLICGSVVWISYRAFLTSELSVATKVLPFNDLESLANTDYK
jgi:hypothetical protein